MAITLYKLADQLGAQGVDEVTLSAPQLRYRSTNESRFGAGMDWRAEMWLTPTGLGDCPPIVGGSIDFLTIRMGEVPIADIIRSLDARIGHFTSLFEGQHIAESVALQFEDAPIDSVLLLVAAFVIEPLRGHGLGPWMAAEAIHRMLDTFNGLVLAFPHPPENSEDGISVSLIEAVERRGEYWRQVGLDPLKRHPGYLGHSTSYTSILDARKALTRADEFQIRANVHELRRPATKPNDQPPRPTGR